jgi:formate dehydrogenase major subunit
MTNHWNDIANADCVLAIGSNPAENHPAAFGHITIAKERGAKLISVDPRFTRTSSKADIYAPLRSGTDIAFVGGMIKYILDDIEQNPQNYNMTYIKEYTNASYLVNPEFKGPADLDGLFIDYIGSSNEADGTKRDYRRTTLLFNWQKIPENWKFQLDENGIPKRDRDLKDPHCVFQILKQHYARYTPEMVNKICGTPQDVFLEVCRTYAATGQTGKSGTILYAMGTTQHTYGAQNIRAYSILQLLLANIGIAGGGINAMRGESNVQGSTDFALLFHILPGYLPMFEDRDTTLEQYTNRVTPVNPDPLSLNWWKNRPKYVVSLLKAWYGDAATPDNEFGYQYLPKIEYYPDQVKTKNYSHIALFEAMEKGVIKGFMVWGQNPAVGGPNANQERAAMDKLDWMVVADMWHTETANFWKRPGANPADIKTEVFLLPALNSYEKEGSVTNSGRWMQWRYKAADGPGDAREDLWMVDQIARKLKELYSQEGGPNAEAITNLTWGYGDDHPSPREVAKEINGYDVATKKQIDGFANLKNDGTTACGEWVYCGSYVEAEKEPTAPIPGNRASRRNLDDGPFNIGLHPKWAWCWPVNRRIIYNRASVDLNGEPWDKEHPVVKWNPTKGETGGWDGDIVDGAATAKPMAEGGHYPFIMTVEGHARLFGPGMIDGPLPEHYEPWESPIDNPMSQQQNDPAFKIWRPEEKGTPDEYPIVCSTYRVVEHWQGGQMTRNMPWVVEAMPEPFVEMSEELAAEKGIKNGEKVIVESARGQVKMAAVVTKRFKPFQLNGRKVHQVGIPWHWGFIGLSTGDSANVLTPHVGDANTMIPEYKAFLVNVRKA